MLRSHRQWLRARELVREGRIGALRVVQDSFSYMNVDPANVRPRCAGRSATPSRAEAAIARTTRKEPERT
jgi:predicted dehydrogenase